MAANSNSSRMDWGTQKKRDMWQMNEKVKNKEKLTWENGVYRGRLILMVAELVGETWQ